MKFGTAKKYDPTGEGNLTEGIPPQIRGKVVCDGNQQPKYTARRNHPRVIHRASCSLYYGANSDIQRLLISNLGEHIIKALGKDHYPKFLFYLDMLKSKGFERYSGLDLIIYYLTSYTCKGGENSVVWGKSIQAMLESYVDDGNEDANLRSLVATVMNSVSKQKSAPRAECMFSLSGGILKRSSYGFTRVCSIKDIELDAVRDVIQPPSSVHGNGTPAIEEPDTSFLWSTITKNYIKRDASLNALNVYNILLMCS